MRRRNLMKSRKFQLCLSAFQRAYNGYRGSGRTLKRGAQIEEMKPVAEKDNNNMR